MADLTTKKPHPLSKEGRALRAAAAAQEQLAPETTNVETTVEPTKEVKALTPDNWMAYVLEEISKLKSENEVLKQKMTHPTVIWKERNEEPKLFSYKMWGGIPVLTYVSKRRDTSKDFVFKNQYWTYESNHDLVLQLADSTSMSVDVNEFNRDFTRSEKITALDHHGEIITNDNIKFAKFYTFTDNGMTFTVLPNCIN